MKRVCINGVNTKCKPVGQRMSEGKKAQYCTVQISLAYSHSSRSFLIYASNVSIARIPRLQLNRDIARRIQVYPRPFRLYKGIKV